MAKREEENGTLYSKDNEYSGCQPLGPDPYDLAVCYGFVLQVIYDKLSRLNLIPAISQPLPR